MSYHMFIYKFLNIWDQSYKIMEKLMIKNHTECVQVGWLTWRNKFKIICDYKVFTKLKYKFYRITIYLFILYGSGRWDLKRQYERKKRVLSIIKMLRWKKW